MLKNNKSILSKLKTFSLGASAADLAMLLLVFFMATTTTEPPKGASVELPQAVTKGAEQDSIYITISKDQKIYFDGNEINLDELNNQLIIRKNEKDRIVSITADKDLNYKIISDIINILKKNDFLNLVFIAQPRENE